MYSIVFMTKKLLVRIEQSTAIGFRFLPSFKFNRYTGLKFIVITTNVKDKRLCKFFTWKAFQEGTAKINETCASEFGLAHVLYM